MTAEEYRLAQLKAKTEAEVQAEVIDALPVHERGGPETGVGWQAAIRRVRDLEA